MSITKTLFVPLSWEGPDDNDGSHIWLEDDDNFCPYCGWPECECKCTDLDYFEPEQEEEDSDE